MNSYNVSTKVWGTKNSAELPKRLTAPRQPENRADLAFRSGLIFDFSLRLSRLNPLIVANFVGEILRLKCLCFSLALAVAGGRAALSMEQDFKDFRFSNDAILEFVFGGEKPGAYFIEQSRGPRRPIVIGTPTAIPGRKIPSRDRHTELTEINGQKVYVFNEVTHQPFLFANIDHKLWFFHQSGRAFQLPLHEDLLSRGYGQVFQFSYSIVAHNNQNFLVLQFPFGPEDSSDFSLAEVMVVDEEGHFVRSTYMGGKDIPENWAQTVKVDSRGILKLPDCVRDEVDLERFVQETEFEGVITRTLRVRRKNQEVEIQPQVLVEQAFRRLTPQSPLLRKAMDPADLSEFDEMRVALLKKKLGSFVLLGPGGSGKTQLKRAFYKHLLAGDFPEFPRTLRVYSIDPGSISMGGENVGIIETRMLALTEVLRAWPSLCDVDEIHSIRGQGTHEGQMNDIFQSLKTALADGEIHMGGESTAVEFNHAFQGDRPLYERFKRISKRPMTEAEVKAAIANSLTSLHGLPSHPEIVNRIYDNSNTYNVIGAQPRKAVDIVDEMGARWKKDGRPQRSRTVEDVDLATKGLHNVDPAEFTPAKRLARLRQARKFIGDRFVGQNEVIASLFEFMKMVYTGHTSAGRPRGSFLFAGDTGLGKTQLAELVADSLGLQRVTISMANLDPRLGRLAVLNPIAEALRANSFTVIIVDEIDRADPDIVEAYFQLLDKGSFDSSENVSTVARGGVASVPVDVTKAIFIATTNAGKVLSRTEQGSMIISNGNPRSHQTHKEIKDRLERDGLPRPLLNRFDGIFIFKYYDHEQFRQILVTAARWLEKEFSKDKSPDLVSSVTDSFHLKAMIDDLVRRHGDTVDGAREAIGELRREYGRRFANETLRADAVALGEDCSDLLGGESVWDFLPEPELKR